MGPAGTMRTLWKFQKTWYSYSCPPYSPELNPVEHIWGHLRDYYFRNRTFENLDAVEEALMDGLVNLINTPELVKSMALFSWLKTLW
jgi:transposase